MPRYPIGPGSEDRYQSQPRRHRRPSKASPIVSYILSIVPTYPGMISVETIRQHIVRHPEFRYTFATEPVSLYARMGNMVQRCRVIRIAKGIYAKPRNAQDIGMKWRPMKPMPKPTLSQQLRTANAALRDQLGAEPKKRNHTRNLFAPPWSNYPKKSPQ